MTFGLQRFAAPFALGGGWAAVSVLAAALVLAPILALGFVALTPMFGGALASGSESASEAWRHLAAYVLPQAVSQTAILLAGVGVITMIVGTGAAWLVSAYDFPGRKVLDWALLLPLAVPTYIVAYVYLDLLHPVGPVQTALRAVLGIENPQDFRLPDVRSMWGCILLLGFVLYPYVYLTARALFLMQAANLIEAAQTLGANRLAVFRKVALPLARPAIAVGMSLALMEALNDIGASEFLGVRTMTVAIYTTWVTRSDLVGAAQIALIMLALVVALVVVERWFRRRLSYAAAAQRPRRMPPRRLIGAQKWVALGFGSVPTLIGFAIPTAYLMDAAAERISFSGFPRGVAIATANTFVLSTAAAAITVLLGLGLAYFMRLAPGQSARGIARVAGLGYAVPGTVLAIGLLAPIGAVDLLIHDLARVVFGISTGLVVLGSGAALLYAYVARFITIPTGGIEAGFSRLSPSLDHAARTLGQTPGGTLWRVHLPLLRPALGAAAILVFVDCMKELPATLLLRPLNFETLATFLYGEAARGTYEDGAIAALMIVLAGIIPVIVLARMSRSTYAGTNT